MIRGNQPEASACRRPLVALSLAAAPAAFAAEAMSSPDAALPFPALSLAWPLALLALAIAAAALAWAWRSRGLQRELERQLQADRAGAHALGGLLDVWQWRSDAAHRLVAWRPPVDSPPGDWPMPSPPPLLWDHFQADPDTAAALRGRLERHAPLEALPAWHADATGRRRALLLRGAAFLDAQGRFAGYQGTAREWGDADASDAAALAEALSTPVLRLALAASGAPLAQANAAAAQWLNLEEDERHALGWNALLKRLPAGLRTGVEQAVAATGPADASTHDGWTLRAHRPQPALHGETPSLWLLFQPEASNAGTREADRADHASFGYTVSHDLRAPIRVVEGFTRIVKEDYGRLLDRMGNDHLDRVLGAAARMNSMIDSLLALSQLSAQPLSRQPINLSQLAAYIVDDLRRESPGREVVVDIEPGLLAHGDATLMRVALENLLGNAWKYTAKSRAAHITFERSEHEGRPAFTLRDNGAGFDMRFADRLFGVFQRLHSANDFQGTGVGLASVRRIVRRHGGDIWAEGEVDRGARFQFWIPD
jgi:signal transduction histidine kinase